MAPREEERELMLVLDYILNRCTLREIDAVETAVERRRMDLTSQTGIVSLDPSRAAQKMSGVVQDSIEKGMEGIRRTFREYAVDLIRKEAPELSEDQMAELIDGWIPENRSHDEKPASPGPYSGLSRKGLINGVPPDAMYEMVCQFVAYSTGKMGISEEASLRDEIGNWTDSYWKTFPAQIRECIRDFLSAAIDGAEMDRRLSRLLQ